MTWVTRCLDMGVAGWLLMGMFWLAFIALVLWALRQLFPLNRPSTPTPGHVGPDPATVSVPAGAPGASGSALRDDLARSR